MRTPICDFLREYAEREAVRLHMPGHKGKTVLGPEKLDITEIHGADVLYSACGIIKESEDIASSLFGSGKTLYSAEGSSLAIRAMLYLIKRYATEKGERAKILAGRNAHKTFITASAILDIDVRYIAPDEISAQIAAEKPTAVYVTSPDYLGKCADTRNLSETCHKNGAVLIVDNAHGAYLKFLKESRHPIDLGADMCCDSAHKTLPVLTGGAYLHIAKGAPAEFSEYAEDAMALFASTSPSYLILASLDNANKVISEEKNLFDEVSFLAKSFKRKLSDHGYTLVGDEPLKITIAPKSFGYTGEELAEKLLKDGVVCEFADRDFLVMMFSIKTTEEELSKTERALLSYERREAIDETPPRLSPAEFVISPNEALILPSETVEVEKCEGRTFADISVSCPPAVPIVICGEKINKELIESLKYYGVKTCKVVK